MTSEDEETLALAREQGARAARQAIEHDAPSDPLQLVAWTAGFGSEPDVAAAVANAREAGRTWREIATALGQNMRTVMTKFGGGYEAQRRYRQRRQSEDG